VVVKTRAGESEMSDYLVNRTDRATPGSPPTRFQVSRSGEQGRSAELSWGPPDVPNGPIEFYEVFYSYQDFMGRSQEREMMVEARRARLIDLDAYADYEVGVRACTRMPELPEPVCGRDWAKGRFLTGIGGENRHLLPRQLVLRSRNWQENSIWQFFPESGQMPTPLVKFRNRTEVLVEWGHAFHKGGPIDRFDLLVAHQTLGEEAVVRADAKSNSLVLSLEQLGSEQDWTPDCSNHSVTNLYNFSVRAVTSDNGKVYFGEWSPVEVVPGYCKGEISGTKRASSIFEKKYSNSTSNRVSPCSLWSSQFSLTSAEFPLAVDSKSASLSPLAKLF